MIKDEIMVQRFTHVFHPDLTPNGASLGSLYTPLNFHYLNYQVAGHRTVTQISLLLLIRQKYTSYMEIILVKNIIITAIRINYPHILEILKMFGSKHDIQTKQ